MKLFRIIAESYIIEVKAKKVKKWIPDDKGNLKKVIKKICVDSDGNKASGFKLVGGKKCQKMSPDEIRTKKKASKKSQKTKLKNSSKIARKADKIRKKRIAKGLIDPGENDG